MRTCMCVYIYIYIPIYIHTMRVHTRIMSYIMWIYIYIYICTCRCVYIYIYIYIYTYICTRRRDGAQNIMWQLSQLYLSFSSRWLVVQLLVCSVHTYKTQETFVSLEHPWGAGGIRGRASTRDSRGMAEMTRRTSFRYSGARTHTHINALYAPLLCGKDAQSTAEARRCKTRHTCFNVMGEAWGN